MHLHRWHPALITLIWVCALAFAVLLIGENGQHREIVSFPLIVLCTLPLAWMRSLHQAVSAPIKLQEEALFLSTSGLLATSLWLAPRLALSAGPPQLTPLSSMAALGVLGYLSCCALTAHALREFEAAEGSSKKSAIGTAILLVYFPLGVWLLRSRLPPSDD
jgi:hypothetical protein